MSIETPIGSTGSAGTGLPSSNQSSAGSGTSGETGVKQAAGEAKQQTKAVASEAKQHITAMADQTRSEVRQQAQQRTQQLSSSLNGLAGQLRSLRSGNPEGAGSLQHYLVDAEQRLTSFAQRIEQGGPDAMMRDVRMFARRKPATFLAAALGAGFVAGRLVRVGVAATHDQQQDQQYRQYQDAQYGTSGVIGYGSNAMPAGSAIGSTGGSITDPATGMPMSSAVDPAIGRDSGAFA